MTNPLLSGFSDENADSLSNDSLKFNKEFSADSIDNIIDINLFKNDNRK